MTKHLWLPYTQMQNHSPQLAVIDAQGSKIFLKDGHELIDGIASWWAVAHGYNHPHIINAITKQAQILPHIMLAGFAVDSTYELAERLCRFACMDHVFLSDSGSVAVEVAMKIAWQFYLNRGDSGRTKFVSFKGSYHGDTTGAMSLADLSDGMHKKFEKLLLSNFSLPLDVNQFEDFVKKNKNILAGVFVEPMVQCAGGMRFYSAEVLREIFLIAQKHDVLFIADECATGFYRTGKKFAYDHAKISPDILIVSKALTGGTIGLAATLVKEKIFTEFFGDSLDSALMHGPTFTGNPLACAAANASLDLFERQDYGQKVLAVEQVLWAELSGFKNARVLGAIGAIDVSMDWQKTLELRKKFIEHGVFLRPFAGCVYLMPALTITESELKKIINSIRSLF
ncbi:MAG: adenosylmethionine--8-amino-7-oxononanoate transaminase [Alphaproteobacteria bacterium]|nr:adenosylmethionine--8-amino-7-oxononanoate transaminase [Alphaproteobacteria bacterium]